MTGLTVNVTRAPCRRNWAPSPSAATLVFTGVGSGKAFAPTITITGSNFGKTAPGPDPATAPSCGTPTSGFDYGAKLYFNDWTSGWQAGHSGDCIGFVINSWTPTQIKLTLGDFYFDAQYGAILSGDQYGGEGGSAHRHRQ